eukprot:933101-Pelagomonas_calceolata.AAC.3
MKNVLRMLHPLLDMLLHLRALVTSCRWATLSALRTAPVRRPSSSEWTTSIASTLYLLSPIPFTRWERIPAYPKEECQLETHCLSVVSFVSTQCPSTLDPTVPSFVFFECPSMLDLDCIVAIKWLPAYKQHSLCLKSIDTAKGQLLTKMGHIQYLRQRPELAD